VSKTVVIINGIVLLLCIAIFGILVILHKEDLPQEKLSPDAKPGINSGMLKKGEFLRTVSEYIANRYPFRIQFLEFNSALDRLAADGIVNGIYIDDEMLLHLRTYTEHTFEYAEKINEFASNRATSVFVVAVPTSDGIYEELLPEYLVSITQKSVIERFYNALDMGVRKVDAFNTLKMYSSEYIYYRNDTKWTTYGAYCVYKTAIKKLGFTPISYDKFVVEHITDNFRGNLYSKSLYSGTKTDTIDIAKCRSGCEITSIRTYDSELTAADGLIYDKKYLNSNYMYDVFLGGNNNPIVVETNAESDMKILIIKDEYANCFIPFLVNHYSKIVVVDNQCDLDKYESVFAVEDFSQVLFISGIDTFLK